MNTPTPLPKIFLLIVTILSQTYSTLLAADQPQMLQTLVEKHNEAIRKVDKVFIEELQKLKTSYTKAGDLDSANAVVAVIEGIPVATQPNKGSKKLYDKIINTTWNYHHKSAIVNFEFKEANLLRGRTVWGDAKWRVISDSEIIIEHPNGAKMVMTFDKSFGSFYGHDWDGSRVTGVKDSK